MPSTQVRQIQQDFRVGIQRGVPPHLIDDRGLYDLIDGLYEDDGSPFGRGGSEYLTTSGFGSTGLRFIWDGFMDAGRRTVVANASDFGVLASDDLSVVNLGSDGLTLPKSCALLSGCLFIGGGYVYGGSRKTANYTTGTVTFTNGSRTVTGAGTTWSTNLDAGMLIQRGNERVYVIDSVDSDTQITLRDAYTGVTGAGVAYTATPFYKMTAADPYEISDHYWTCANRLVWTFENFIRFSAVDDPHTAWDTDNEHELPEGVRATGGESVGNTSIIFTTGGMWGLDGLPFEITDSNGNPQHRFQVLSRERILFGHTGIATWEQALVVPCSDGIYLVDGVSAPQKLSESIDALYIPYVEAGYLPGQATVFRRHYFLPILNADAEVQDLLVCRLDLPTQTRQNKRTFPWSRFANSGGNVVAFANRSGESVPDPNLLAAEGNATSRVLDVTSYFEPDASNKSDADGTPKTLDLITRDYETGNLTENVVRSVRVRKVLVDAGSDNPELDVFYATGDIDPNLPYWGAPDGEWGAGFGPGGDQPWTDAETAAFVSACSLAEDPDGMHPTRCRINNRSRYIRYRLRCDDPCALLRIRSIETFIRPSQAVRR